MTGALPVRSGTAPGRVSAGQCTKSPYLRLLLVRKAVHLGETVPRKSTLGAPDNGAPFLCWSADPAGAAGASGKNAGHDERCASCQGWQTVQAVRAFPVRLLRRQALPDTAAVRVNSWRRASLCSPSAGTGPNCGTSPSMVAPGDSIRTGPEGVPTST